jgi:hypothetical protein
VVAGVRVGDATAARSDALQASRIKRLKKQEKCSTPPTPAAVVVAFASEELTFRRCWIA